MASLHAALVRKTTTTQTARRKPHIDLALRPLALLMGVAGLTSLSAFAQIAPTTLPTGGQVTAGSAVIGQAGSAMTVNQSSNKAVIDWSTFNIGRDATVRFTQPTPGSIVLNRVGAGGGQSIIDGGLASNGQVWLLNPGGTLFSSTASVNVGGLLNTSLNVSNDDFLAGTYRFAKTTDAPGSITNLGTLTAADGGYIALLAPEVRNEGVISARLGTVALASGTEIRLDMTGGGLIEVAVDASSVSGLIDNKNLVQADGGWVVMSAGAASSLSSGAINTTGVVRAQSLAEHGGVIKLEGGFVALGGVVSADAATVSVARGTKDSIGYTDLLDQPDALAVSGSGRAIHAGSISVSASSNLSLADTVSASSTSGKGGSVSYQAGGSVTETSTSHTSASGTLGGGSISNIASGGIMSSGSYTASSTQGAGGQIDLSGGSVRLLSSTLDASGRTQGGMVRIGGAFQGGKAQDDTGSDAYARFIGRNAAQFGPLVPLERSARTLVNDSTSINVSGRTGAGGTAVVWSDEQTTFLGKINAAGGSDAAGGAVEISSAADLRYVNLDGLSMGTGGSVLLDPKNIVIGDFATAGAWTYQAILGKGYAPAAKNVDVAGLEANDVLGTSVALNAAGDRLAVGAYGDRGFGNVAFGSGAVRLYSFGDTSFSGATLQATLGKGYTGGKNVDVAALEVQDVFGTSVALNAAGDRLAVGATGDAGFANAVANSGAVRLYSFSDTNFSGGTLQATLGKGYTGGKNVDVAGLEAADVFGFAVALNAAGDRLAVGARYDAGFGNAASNSGAVHLFSFSDTNFSGGTLQATLGKGYTGGKNVDVAGLEANDQFGGSVAMNAAGDRLAVGSIHDDGFSNVATSSGAVRLYSFSDASFNGATLQATLGKGYTGGKNVDMAGLDANDIFGFAVALNAAGDRLAAGAFFDDGFGNVAIDSGAVHLFTFTDTNFSGGAQVGTMGKGYTASTPAKSLDISSLEGGTSSYPNLGDSFGSPALNAAGDRLAVGATLDDGVSNGSQLYGAVRLFSFTDTNFSGGTLQATLGQGYTGGKNIDVTVPLGGGGGGGLPTAKHFGGSVSLNASGDRLAVGAVGDGVDTGRGAVLLFSFADNLFSSGVHEASLCRSCTGGKNYNVSDLTDWVRFGSGVSLNATGDRLAVGAFMENGPIDQGRGTVRLFSFTDDKFAGAALEAKLTAGATGGKNVDVPLDVSDGFGISVSLNAAANRLAVGAYRDAGFENTAPSAGAVRLFSFTDNNFSGGTLQATLGQGYTGGKNLDVAGLEAGDAFYAVALNAAGDKLAVGAPGDGGFGNVAAKSGAVRIFGFTDINFSSGTQQAIIGKGYTGANNVDVANLEANDSFGGVSLNGAGDKLAVSAGGDSGYGNAAALSAGAVYLFSMASTPGTTSSLAFANNPAGNETIDRLTLQNQLSAGTSVTLQASNDITLNAGSNIVVNNPTGNGGNLTLQAGRNVTANSSIFTDNGNFTVVAGDPGANPAQRDPGTPTGTTGPGVSINVGDGTYIAAAIGGNLVNNNTTGNAIVTSPLGRYLTYAADPATSAKGTPGTYTKHYNEPYVPGVTPAYAATGNWQFYSITPTLQVAAKPLTWGNTPEPVVPVITGFIDGDTPSAAVAGAPEFEVAGPYSAAGFPTAGTHDVRYLGGYNSPLGYQFANNTAVVNELTVSTPVVNNVAPIGVTSAVSSAVSQVSVAPAASTTTTSLAAVAATENLGTGGATGNNFVAVAAAAQTAATTPDAPPPPHPKLVVNSSKTAPTLAGVLTRADLAAYDEQQKEARKQLFADAIALLKDDAKAADISDCAVDGGENCLVKSLIKGRAETYTPIVKKRHALLIGNNEYRSPIESLRTPLNDVTAMGEELKARFGYEVTVVQNAERKDIIAALNNLISTTGQDDSVLVMYAGHGYLDETSKTGYWIPSDASHISPDKWISNDTIARALKNMLAKQVMLVSDSCYSGTLTKEGKVIETVGVSREDTLTRRSVLAMSSGGDEPVSDEGRENHSIFAWSMLSALKNMKAETQGATLFSQVKKDVTKEFPQVPQYGTVVSAGHTDGGEYLVTPVRAGGAQQ